MNVNEIPQMIEKGMMEHYQLLASHGLTPAENARLAYEHKQPPVVPFFFADMGMVFPGQDLDHYVGPEYGRDAWGVRWKFVPEEGSPMPLPEEDGSYILEDICDWREVVHFPDLDAYDWATNADRDIHGYLTDQA